jgi:hypothetical protein
MAQGEAEAIVRVARLVELPWASLGGEPQGGGKIRRGLFRHRQDRQHPDRSLQHGGPQHPDRRRDVGGEIAGRGRAGLRGELCMNTMNSMGFVDTHARVVIATSRADDTALARSNAVKAAYD